MTTLGIHDILMQVGDQKPGYQLEWPKWLRFSQLCRFKYSVGASARQALNT